MAGFVQVWGSQQLEQGVPGCPDYHGVTGPNTHAIIISNDSECILDYKSDVDPLLLVPARTALTIPCTVNMQYVLAVDSSSVPTATSNQLVIASESQDALAYSSTPLPAPNLIQFIATIFPGTVHLPIPPQFTAIIVVPVNTQASLSINGDDTGYQYFSGAFDLPITLQMFPGMDSSLLFVGSGGGQTNVYGLTLPLTEIGTSVSTLATLTGPIDLAQDGNPFLPGRLAVLSLIAGYDVSTHLQHLISAGDDSADGRTAYNRNALAAISHLQAYNGTSYDRLRALGDNADAVAADTLGRLLALARLTAYNGATYDRLRALGDNADAVPVNTLGALLALARNTVWNGTAWDRLPGSTLGQIADLVPAKTAEATSAANAAVTLTIPAPGAGLRLIIDYVRINIWCTSAISASPDAVALGGLDVAGAAWVYSRVLAANAVATIIDQTFPHGLRASLSNNAVTFTVNAIGATGLSRIFVGYHAQNSSLV